MNEKMRLDHLLKRLPTLRTGHLYPTAQFHCFRGLPVDLRLKIWSFAANVPRDVKIFSRQRHRIRNTDVQGQSKVPAVLHPCQESREEAQRYYTKCTMIASRKSGRLWINFEVDRFLFDAGEYVNRTRFNASLNFERDVLAQIRQLSIQQYFNISYGLQNTIELVSYAQLSKLTICFIGWRHHNTEEGVSPHLRLHRLCSSVKNQIPIFRLQFENLNCPIEVLFCTQAESDLDPWASEPDIYPVTEYEYQDTAISKEDYFRSLGPVTIQSLEDISQGHFQFLDTSRITRPNHVLVDDEEQQFPNIAFTSFSS